MKLTEIRLRLLRILKGIVIIVVSVFATTTILTGCGNKTYPRPISQLAKPEIRDLRAKVTSKGVELDWSIPESVRTGEKRALHHFMIYKEQLKWENRDCPECPPVAQQEGVRIELSAPQPARLEGNNLTWLDTGVSKNQAYRYHITLVGKKDRQIAQSNPVLVRVMPAPGPLKDLQVTTQSQGILLHWKVPTKDDQGQPLQGELQFTIDRRTGNGEWEKLSTVPIRANNFLDKSIASNQTYDYRVTPTLIFEGTPIAGEPALFAHAQAPGSVPPPPPKAVWAIPTKGGIEVEWTESEGKVSGYHVYRREGKEITRLTGTPVQKAPFLDRSVKRNAVYSYAVSAVAVQPDQKEGLLSKWIEIRSLMTE